MYILFNKVLLPFLYYSISKHQKFEFDIGQSIRYHDGSIINYSFFIYVDFVYIRGGSYKKFICLHKEGDNRSWDFSDTFVNLRFGLNGLFDSVFTTEPLKFSITFKNTEMVRKINHYINNIMRIDVISHCRKKITVYKINNKKTFKSEYCVICLTNPPNVLFCNCGHLCLCVECEEVRGFHVCPMCKTENTIKRTI